MTRIAGIIAILTLAACTVPAYDRNSSPTLYQALDTQPDGYTGNLADGSGTFEIASTFSNGTTLCRVANISTAGRFETESFCKARGGEWR
jgi:hypothetical protein